MELQPENLCLILSFKNDALQEKFCHKIFGQKDFPANY